VPQLMMIGTSHKSADIAFRESLVRAVGADHMLASLEAAKETAVLSTCNRFELYVASELPRGDLCFVLQVRRRRHGRSGASHAFTRQGRRSR